MKILYGIMFGVINLAAIVLILVFGNVFSDDKNETSTVENDSGSVDSSVAFSGNFSANFSVSDGLELDEQRANLSAIAGNLSSVRVDNEKKFDASENNSTEKTRLDDFKPSPQLETYFEFNDFPVRPVFPQANTVTNYQDFHAEGEFLPSVNGIARNLNNGFVPGFPIFGNGKERNISDESRSEMHTINGSENPQNFGKKTARNQAGIMKNQYGGDTPWVTRIAFPNNQATYDSPYPFVTGTTGSDQNPSCCQDNVVPSSTYPPFTDINKSTQDVNGNKKYLPFLRSPSFPPTAGFDSSVVPQQGYSAPTPPQFNTDNNENRNKYFSPTSSGSAGDFNFNKLVEVPKNYHSGYVNGHTPRQKTFDTYNLMEKPYSETEYKTYDGGLYYSPWKKILKLFATFIPIGLLISALTPTVISVTNVNDTNIDPNMSASRYRSNDESRKELTNHLLSSLDFFDKLNENGCEYRVFCELLVSASHMTNSKRHVDTLLDNFAKQEIDYKSRAEDLKQVFEAVRNHNCHSIPCEYIQKPT